MFTRLAIRVTHGPGRRSSRPLVAAALCAALVAATPAASHAETVDDVDAVGDMIVYDGAPIPVPDRTLNDVSNTRFTHGGRRVAIRVDYVDLKKKAGGVGQWFLIHMITNEGVRRHLDLVASSGHWSGATQMYNRRYASVDCSVRHSIDYEANVTKLSFPRRCVSKPRWMVFRAHSLVESEDGVYEDDALRNRPIAADDRHLKRSQRVHHK